MKLLPRTSLLRVLPVPHNAVSRVPCDLQQRYDQPFSCEGEHLLRWFLGAVITHKTNPQGASVHAFAVSAMLEYRSTDQDLIVAADFFYTEVICDV